MGITYIFEYGSLVNDGSLSSTLININGFSDTQIDSLEQLLNPGVSQKIDEKISSFVGLAVFGEDGMLKT